VHPCSGRGDRLTTMRWTAAPGRPIRSTESSAGRTAVRSPHGLVGASRSAATVALVGLFIIALFAALYVGRAFVVPIVLAMHLALVLSPAVRALRRRGLPGPAGAALVLLGLLAAFFPSGGAISLSASSTAWRPTSSRRSCWSGGSR